MKPQTRQALLALNRAFYRTRGEAFAASRTRPWSGWTQALRWLPPGADVVDLGCGHGRFAAFLADHCPSPPRSYLGLDESRVLLDMAQAEAHAPWVRFEHADLLGRPLSAALPRRSCDAICLFGLLHHVPGNRERLAFIDGALASLRPGGRLLATLWRFDQHPRFATKHLDPAAFDPRWGVAPEALEPGDHLLGFGDRDDTPRYCHFPSDDEAERICDRPGARLCTRYRPDAGDRFNEYLVLEATR